MPVMNWTSRSNPSAKSRMGDGAIFAQLEIPPVVLWVEAELGDFFLQDVEPLFALASRR